MSQWSPRIIGLAGQAGAGKDYTFNAWAEAGWPVVRVALADQVREELEEVLEASLPILWQKPTSPEVRVLLQMWGTNYRRAQDPDYWTTRGIELAERVYEAGYMYPVITDVRFKNEAEAIRRAGGTVVKVSRPELIRAKALGYQLADPYDWERFNSMSQHPSEAEAAQIRGDVYLLPEDGPQAALDLGRRLFGPPSGLDRSGERLFATTTLTSETA